MLGSLPSLGSGKVFVPFQIKFHGVWVDRSGGWAYIFGAGKGLWTISNQIPWGAGKQVGWAVFKFCFGMCDLWQDTAILPSFLESSFAPNPIWWLWFHHHLAERLDMPPPRRLHISFPCQQIVKPQIGNPIFRTAKWLKWRRWTDWRDWVKQATLQACPAAEMQAYCMDASGTSMHHCCKCHGPTQFPAIQKVWSHASMQIKEHMLQELEHDSLYIHAVNTWNMYQALTLEHQHVNTVQNTNIPTPKYDIM